MTPKRGRPYGFPLLADLLVGNSVVVAAKDLKRATTTIKTLHKKLGFQFDAMGKSEDGSVHYCRTA
jgi:hypothetical protein